MTTVLIDDFNALGPWQALTPADAPSSDITLALDDPGPALPSGGTSVSVTIAATATGHRLERAVPATDLSAFRELRVWVRGDRPTDPRSANPFRLELRLGSSALPINAPGNDWHRRIPIAPAGCWSLVRLALDDLPVAVRGAVTHVALYVLAGEGGLQVWLDDLRAAAPAMVPDADAAMVAALDNGLVIGGTPVRAIQDVPGAIVPTAPWIGIVNQGATPADMLGSQSRRSADYSTTGHRIYPAPEAWHLHYRIQFATTDAGAQAAMHDFVVARLGIYATIDIGGLAHRIERIRKVERRDAQAMEPSLRYRLTVTRETGGGVPVLPVGEVRLATGYNEEAA